MKKHLYILLVLFVFTMGSLYAQTYEVGAGASSWTYPFYNLYTNARTHTIYTAAELAAAGMPANTPIGSMKWNFSTAPGQAENVFVVRMQATTDALFATSDFLTTGWTECYNGPADFSASSGWDGVDFTTPFVWDGTSNLLVDVCFYNYDGGSNWTSNGTVTADAAADSRSIFWRTDSDIDPCSDPAAITSGTLSTNVPCAQFTAFSASMPTPATNPMPADGETGVATSGNLTWDWGSNNLTYDLWFGEAGSATEVVTGGNCGASGLYPFSGLNEWTDYEWWVVSYNGAEYVESTHWTFTTELPPGMVQIGAGAVTAQSLPWEMWFGYTLSQTIYLQSDINTANQQIETIAYYYNGNSAYTEDEINIWMGHTADSELTAYQSLNNFTEVYSGPLSVPAVEGWVQIPLDTPFVYNNTDNLIVMFRANTTGYSDSGDEFYCTADTRANVSITTYNDTTPYDPAAPPTGTLKAYYPNIIMEFGDVSTSPVFAVNPTAMDFADTYKGTAAGPQTFTMSNNGMGTLQITDVSLVGADAAMFSLTDVNTYPVALGLSETATFDVDFMPTAVGSFSASIEITDNLRQVHTIPLTGDGLDPFEVSPISYNFGGVYLGLTGGPQTFTITNNGGVDLQITDVMVVGADAALFPLTDTNTYPVTLAGAGTMTFDASFMPVAVGNFTADIQITDDQRNVYTVTLDGEGLNPIDISPASVAFGNVGNGTTSDPETITITNNGASLTLTGVVLTGNNPEHFALTDFTHYPITLNNGETHDFTVTFEPTLYGDWDAAIEVTDTYREVHTIPLTGSSVEPAIWAEDFEEGGALPTGWTQDTNDQHDWTVDAGGTTSSSTGPSVDHTLGTTAGYYVYYETSTPVATGDTAIVISPVKDLSLVSGATFNFWYHMYGSSMGTLCVDFWDGSAWNEMWTLSGDQGDAWFEGAISLDGYYISDWQMRFRGICGGPTAYWSDMAFDDVSITASSPGQITGYVLEVGTGNPIVGAEVAAGSEITTSSATGYYEILDLQPGGYDMTVTHDMYIGQAANNVQVNPGAGTTQNFDLGWAEISVNVSSFTSTLNPGETDTQQMIITNNGNEDLVYSISKQENVVRTTSLPPVSMDYPRCEAPNSADMDPNAIGGLHMSTPFNTRASTALGWYAQGDNFVTFPINDPATMTAVYGTSASEHSFYAGDWLPGSTNEFYVLNGHDPGTGVYNNDCFLFDTVAGTLTNLGAVPTSGGTAWAGATGNPYTGQMYACTTSELYLFDPTIPAVTSVAPFTNASFMIDIAVGGDGVLYGHDIGNDVIVSIDPATAICTPIGATGFDANYAQGMFTDWETGEVYLAAYNGGTSTGELRLVDLATGATAVTGTFGSSMEVCATGVPSDMWMTFAPQSGTIAAGGFETVDVTFDAAMLDGVVKTGNVVISNNANYTAVRGDDYLIPFTITVMGTPAVPMPMITMSGDDAVLTWDPITGATQYHVYYATDPSGTFMEAAGSPVSAETFTHTGAGAAGTKYYYYVTAEGVVTP